MTLTQIMGAFWLAVAVLAGLACIGGSIIARRIRR